MKAFLLGLWRAERIVLGAAIGTILLMPTDQWLTKATLAILIGAFINGVSKFLREQYGIDLKLI